MYRGQPETFVPGEVVEAVRVGDIANSVDLTWRVDTGNGEPSTATATDAFATKCSLEPPPDPGEPDPGPPDPGEPDPGPPDPEQEPIGIFIDCVTDRGPTYDAVFGYQNNNEDAVAIPVGSDNRFIPGGDRGQTTVFLPGNHSNAFVVERIASGLLLSWAVTHAGTTRFATPFSGMPECGDAPPPLVPVGIFACITDRGGTFDAVFGYENDNTVDVALPIGLRNFFAPQPANRGQPTVFHPGRHDNAFTVRGIRANQVLAWTLAFQGVRTVVVTAAYPIECARPETLPVDVFPLCVSRRGDTYTAAFGYFNANRRDVIVPVGLSNFLRPRPISRGQPSVLRPGVAWHAFSVRGIPVGQPVTWTVRSSGVVARATLTAGFERNCVTTPVLPEAQLEIDKSVEPNTVFVGGRLRFGIVVRNEGTTTSQRTTVIDRPLDSKIAALSARPSQGTCRCPEQPRDVRARRPRSGTHGDHRRRGESARARRLPQPRDRGEPARGLRGRQRGPRDDRRRRRSPRSVRTVADRLSQAALVGDDAVTLRVSDCLICDQIASIDTLPGGSLVDERLVRAYHLPPIDRVPRQYLGRILLVTERHVDHFGELTAEEAEAVGRAGRVVAASLLALDDVARVHTAVIGLGVPHFHQHLFPRYEWMSREADWNALHELPDAPLGGAPEIAALVDRLRPHLQAVT